MNILTLEDRGSVSFYMRRFLEEEGHEILSAFSINDAQTFWEHDNVDCIIADLNLSPLGLTEEEIAASHGGLLTGWIWLSHYVFLERPEMRANTIIYSEYVANLEAAVSANELALTHRVRKRGRTSPAGEVIRLVRDIAVKMGDQE